MEETWSQDQEWWVLLYLHSFHFSPQSAAIFLPFKRLSSSCVVLTLQIEWFCFLNILLLVLSVHLWAAGKNLGDIFMSLAKKIYLQMFRKVILINFVYIQVLEILDSRLICNSTHRKCLFTRIYI